MIADLVPEQVAAAARSGGRLTRHSTAAQSKTAERR
jgi:uncharacterized membrane protein